MAEKKNFLALAVGLGIVGVIIGAVTIWNSVSELLAP
jgi:hypothetical protein